MKRHVRQPRDLGPLLLFKRPGWIPRAQRFANSLTIDDLRLVATLCTRRPAVDYNDGGREDAVSMMRAREELRVFKSIRALFCDVP